MTASETPDPGSENGEKKRAGRNGAARHAEPDAANGECYVSDEKGKNQSETGADRSPSGQKVALTIDFDFNGQIIRTVDHDGQTWFVAREVCKVLGLANTSQTLSRLGGDQKGIILVDTAGGPQTMSIVTEGGLYDLVLTSEKREAQAFRRWVTDEVLPSIRRTGRYEPNAGGAKTERVWGEQGSVQVTLPSFGRFIVTVGPNKTPHVLETELDAAFNDMTLTDFKILCHTSLVVAGWWRKFQQMQGVGVDTTDGLARAKLEQAITEGGQLAEHFLWCWTQIRRRADDRRGDNLPDKRQGSPNRRRSSDARRRARVTSGDPVRRIMSETSAERGGFDEPRRRNTPQDQRQQRNRQGDGHPHRNRGTRPPDPRTAP